MIDINSALSGISDGLGEALSQAGFSLFRPQDTDRNEFPVVVSNDRRFVTFDGSGCSLKIEYCNNTIALQYAEEITEKTADGDYSRLSLSLFNPNEAEISDVRYITDEFADTIMDKFAGGKKPKVTKKQVNSVSKTAVKNGAFYDLASFGNRFIGVYPELKIYYKQNIDEYGEFLAEDFFKKYGTPAVLATIRENNPQKMKKLFNLLNDIYDNGVNDVQSLLVVSVLGAMFNDETMLASCVDYMDSDLCVNVIRVNKYLGSSGSKGARMRLENPPRYKPKKKKQGLMSTLMGGGTPGM